MVDTLPDTKAAPAKNLPLGTFLRGFFVGTKEQSGRTYLLVRGPSDFDPTKTTDRKVSYTPFSPHTGAAFDLPPSGSEIEVQVTADAIPWDGKAFVTFALVGYRIV